MSLFLESQFYPIDLYVYLSCFVVSFEIGTWNPPNLFLFFKMVLAILGPMHFHMDF